MLSQIQRSDLPNAHLANTFLTVLYAATDGHDHTQRLAVHNPYAYSDHNNEHLAQAADTLLVGAVAVASNVQLEKPNDFADHIREQNWQGAYYDGIILATQFLPQDEAKSTLEKHMPV